MKVSPGKAISVLGAVAAAMVTGDALADGYGHAYGHYRDTGYVYARVVDVDPMVRYVAVDRPRQQCWDETVRTPAAPFGIAGQTAAGGDWSAHNPDALERFWQEAKIATR